MRLPSAFAFTLALLAAGTGADAQTAPAPHDGISVVGRGSATADADALRFDVRLGSFGPRSGASAAPGPQSLGQVEGAPRSLAAALSAAGATHVTIALDANLQGANAYPFTVSGLLERPSHDRILSIVVSGALATQSDGSAIPIQSASGSLVVGDCRDLERRADAAAFDDAQARARALAATAHLRLTGVAGISTFGIASPCPSVANDQPVFGFPGAPLPLDGPYRVTLTRDLQVRFTTKP